MRCGVCKYPLGKGRGKRTGASINNFEVILDTDKVPQLRGLPVSVTVNICIKCVEGIANKLITEEHRETVLTLKDLDS